MIRKITLIILSLLLVGIIGTVTVIMLTSERPDNGTPTDSAQGSNPSGGTGDETQNDPSNPGGGTQNPSNPGGSTQNPSNPGGGTGGNTQDNPSDSHTCKFTFSKTVAPDCGHQGYDLYTCTCGKEQKQNYKNATGEHQYVNKIHLATCYSDWYSADECKVCGNVKADSITIVEGTKIDHKYEWTDTVPATCTKAGKRDGVCIWCETTSTQPIPIIDHEYKEYTLNNDATCTEDGTKTASCTMCGKEDTLTVEGSKLGHLCENYYPNNDATCTTPGTLSAWCNRCKTTVTKQGEKDPDAHAYDNFTVVNGTCLQQGTISYKCKYCGKSVTSDTIIQHSFDSNGVCTRCTRSMGRLYITDTHGGNTAKTDDFFSPYVYITVSSVSGNSINFTVEIVMETVDGFTPESIMGGFGEMITDVNSGVSGNVSLSGSLWNYKAETEVPFNFKIAYNYSVKNEYVDFTVTGGGQYTDKNGQTHVCNADTDLKIYVKNEENNHTHRYGEWMTHIGSCIEKSRFERRCLFCSKKDTYDICYEGHDFYSSNNSKCAVCNKDVEKGTVRYRVDLQKPDKKSVTDFGLVYIEMTINSITYVGGGNSDSILSNYRIKFDLYVVQYYVSNGEVKEQRVKPTFNLDNLGWCGFFSFKLFNVNTSSNDELSTWIDCGPFKEGDTFRLYFPLVVYNGNDYHAQHAYEGRVYIYAKF